MRDPMRLLLLAGACAAVSVVSLPAVLGGGMMQTVPLIDWPSVKTPRTIAPSAMPEVLAGRTGAFGTDRPEGKASVDKTLPSANSPRPPKAVFDELGAAGPHRSDATSPVPIAPPVRPPQSQPVQEQPQARLVAGLTDIALAPQAQQPPAAGSGSPVLPPWAQSQPAGARTASDIPAIAGGAPSGSLDRATSNGQTIPAPGAPPPPSASTEVRSLQEMLRPETAPRRGPPPVGLPSGSATPMPRTTGERSAPATPATPPGGAARPSDRPSLAALTTAVVGAGGASSSQSPPGPTEAIPSAQAVTPAGPPGAGPLPPRKPPRETVVGETAQSAAPVPTGTRSATAPSSLKEASQKEAIASADGDPSPPRRPAAAASTPAKPRHETVAQGAAPALPRAGSAPRAAVPGPSYTIPFSEGSASVSRLGIAIVEQAAQAGGTAVLRSSGRPIDRNRLEAVRMEFLMLGVQVVSSEPDPRVASGEVRIEIK